jgi:hypothetical protein
VPAAELVGHVSVLLAQASVRWQLRVLLCGWWQVRLMCEAVSDMLCGGALLKHKFRSWRPAQTYVAHGTI